MLPGPKPRASAPSAAPKRASGLRVSQRSEAKIRPTFQRAFSAQPRRTQEPLIQEQRQRVFAALLSSVQTLGATLQMGHPFGDDLRRFHRGLAQLRILDDLALDSQTLILQIIA